MTQADRGTVAPGALPLLADGIKKEVLAGILKTHCELQAAIVSAALY